MATDRHWSVSRPAAGTGVERLSAAGGQVGDQRSAALRGGRAAGGRDPVERLVFGSQMQFERQAWCFGHMDR